MIFYIPIQNDNLGGSIWLRHIGLTLTYLGNDVRYCDYDSNTSSGDYTVIQSEWIEKEAYKTAKRNIVLLGHFTSVVYPDSTKLRDSDTVLTQWKGEVVEDWEKRSGKKAHYFPHGYYPNNEYIGPYQENDRVDCVWIGSETPFRDESRLDVLNVEKLRSTHVSLVDSIYKDALICPNIHLSIQKGELINVPESILTKPGYAVNERLFWICGAGGFQLADENPIIREFYDEDEVPMANSQEFKMKFEYYLAHPEERMAMAKKAHERTLREHTYEHRIKNIMFPLL